MLPTGLPEAAIGASIAEQYLNQETGVPETDALRLSLRAIFEGKTDVDNITVAGDLINYVRDQVLPSLAGIRRASAITAKSSMTTEEIAQATGQSKAIISRLITEYRNYA